MIDISTTVAVPLTDDQNLMLDVDVIVTVVGDDYEPPQRSVGIAYGRYAELRVKDVQFDGTSIDFMTAPLAGRAIWIAVINLIQDQDSELHGRAQRMLAREYAGAPDGVR